MSFSEILKDLTLRIDRSVGAFIIASDGIPVEGYLREDNIDQSALSAEFSVVLKTVQFALENLQMGKMDDISISTEKNRIIVKKITPDYYIVFILHPDGNAGKARFFLKLTTSRIEKEL